MNHLGLKQTAYDIVKKLLLSGEIKPGDRIREDLLADEISMSRTPVREAINQLAAEGFVNQIPRKGVFATKFTQQELVDIVEARSIIEANAARLCCERASDDEIQKIAKIFDELKDALTRGDMIRAGVLDGEFHKSIAFYSKNKRMYHYVNDIEDLIVFARRMDVYNIRHEYNEENSIIQHQDILTAITERDGGRAFEAMAKNTREVLKRMVYK